MQADALLATVAEVFLPEAQEICQRATRTALDLEATRGLLEEARKERFDSLARDLHTLKGSSATVGLEDVSALAHQMEDLVQPYRRNLELLPAGIVDGLLKALDAFLVRAREHARVATATGADRAWPAPGSSPALTTWRISMQQLTGLIREVERLREGRLRIDERRRELERQIATGPDQRQMSGEVRAALAALSRQILADEQEIGDIVDALEDGVKLICTQPVRVVVEPLFRLVRQLTRDSGKEAKLGAVGAEVSLDRRVLEVLSTALNHLVRNALDHGIEPMDVREAAGKHREGALTLRVEKQGNLVVIELSDDGAGIDVDALKARALADGHANEASLKGMDDHQLHLLAFRSGLSTSAAVTDTSGRGVGLDVVRSQVLALGGHVDLQSTAGQGTRVTIVLPVELGSSPVLVVEVLEHQVGLPMVAVESVQRLKAGAILTGPTHLVLEYREERVRLAPLASLLGLAPPMVPAPGSIVLVVRVGDQRVAIAIDEVVGYWDLVIRPLPAELRGLAAYQGAAMLGASKLVLIVQPEWLVEAGGRHESRGPRAKRALVVDDALTARALHRSMLEAGGFLVQAVQSAEQALHLLEQSAFDVVVCDIAMGGMDGIAFTKLVRSREETRTLPIVLVSAHDADENREHARAVGADGFLTKQDCSQGRLLGEVSDVIARRSRA